MSTMMVVWRAVWLWMSGTGRVYVVDSDAGGVLLFDGEWIVECCW